GGVLRPDEDANKATYGARANPSTILASREISAPPTAAPFLRALGSAASGTASTSRPADTTPRSTAAERRTTTQSTTDDDVRARLVEAQQTLDRVLADSAPSTVGTSGNTSGRSSDGTVTVERARLLHLRQQIEAALSALNKR